MDLRAIIDALPHAIVVTADDGTIMLWNDESAATYGWDEAEVLGRSVLDVLAPAHELQENLDRFDVALVGDDPGGDRAVRRRDGSELRIASRTRRLLDPDGRLVALIGTSEDVTERRAEERAARDLADHFRLALEAGGLGTWRWDLRSGATRWDERLEALFGVPPGGFDGTFDAYVQLLHPDDRESVLARVDRAVREKTTYHVEHRVQWPDGSVHWITGAGSVVLDEHGEVTGTIGCCMDATERVLRVEDRERLASEAVDVADRERVLRERLEFLVAIHEALATAPGREALMTNVTQAAVPRLGDWCSIHLLPSDQLDAVRASPDVEIAHRDPAMVEVARELGQRFPYDPDAPVGVANVIRTGAVEFHPEISAEVLDLADASDEVRSIVEDLELRSSIIVPIVKGQRIFGAMQFVMAGSSRRYRDGDVTLARAVAGRIAATLENRRLNELQRSIADTLQRGLLPATLPEVPGLEVAVRYWPSGESATVGGDFYDLFAIDDEQWGLVIGDVCGTGPGAAAVTGMARHTIRASAWHGDDPETVLRSLNTAILRADTDSFCTAIFGEVRPVGEGFAVDLACGGHPLPIVVDHAGSRTAGGPGTLLGVFADTTFTAETVELEPGALLVLYTDGATDVPGEHGRTPDEFLALVDRAARSADGVDAVADAIHDELAAVLSFESRNDDIALVVLRVAR